MLVSVEWLRSLCPFEQDPDQAARALTSRGLTVDAVGTVGDETVLEIDVPANRPDCLGHRGVARELSAAFGVPLVAPRREEQPGSPDVRVRIKDPDLCARYTARLVRGVRIGPSPAWVSRRLEACGLRSINNVVDASNLVLLELGNPIHFFDLSLIDEATIVVRRARPGEVMTTLDGVERRLESDMLVIADPGRAVALAGVIGGADSEINPATRDVLIEAAHFDPNSIRRTARRLGVATDASHRFERGVDPEGLAAAQDLAARLLAELAGGRPEPGMIDVHPRPLPAARLELRPDRIRRLLGYRPAPEEVVASLESMQLRTHPRDDGSLEVTVPSWRVDLLLEADLVEEVGRHLGYDRIPASLEFGRTAIVHEPAREALAMEERTRDVLAHLGLHEAYSYAMIAEGEDERFVPEGLPAPIALTNPIAEPLSHLRRSILPGLLRAADFNLRRGAEDVRLFEVGRVFHCGRPGELPSEPLRVGVVWSGNAYPAHWSAPRTEADVHHLAGTLEHLMRSLRSSVELVRTSGALSGLHPGRSLTWKLPTGEAIGCCGFLHPDLRDERDLPQDLLLGEIDLDALFALPRATPTFTPLPRVPSVNRDLSLVLGPGTTFERVREVIGGVAPPVPASVAVVDRYEGKPLGPGEVSLTVRLTLQPQERTLKEEEIESFRARVIEALRGGLGISLRE